MPEFWCAIDWLAEKNAELEEQRDAARQSHGGEIAHKGGHTAAQGERVSINPDLRVIPNPEFVAWRQDLKARGVA